MKILLVTPSFYPRVGGLEKYTFNIVLRLTKNYGEEVMVVTTNALKQRECGTGVEELNINHNVIRIYRLPSILRVYSASLDYSWLRTIKDIILKERPDVLNAHMPVPCLSDLAIYLAKKYKIPSILTYHNDVTGETFFKRFIAKSYYVLMGYRTLHIADIIITTSKIYAYKSPYLNRFLNKIRIIPPGIDKKYFRVYCSKEIKYRLGFPQNYNIILFVGRLDKYAKFKGLDYLLMAFKLVHQLNRKTLLLIVGEGDYRHYYELLSQKLRLKEKVRFEGFVEENLLPYYYACSDLVVLPSFNEAEGFGMVLLEAQAAGTPVIGTYAGGIPAAIKCGLIIPPRRPIILAKSILNMLDNIKLWKTKAQKIRRIIAKEYSWETIARKTYNIFCEVSKKC